MKNPVRFLLLVPVPWVFVLTYLLGVVLEHVHHGTISPTAALVSKTAGAVLFTVGAVIAGWGLVLFGKAKTTTVPGKLSGKLVTWGPYRFTRNPMYVGLVLAYLGEAGLLKQIWPVVLLPFTVAYINWTVIPVEEAKLEEAFPNEYKQY
ncbi:MAG: isoprenylcysteine carboxylmethyltransferase family protein, partial [Terriglobales bacterium]